MNAPFKYNPGVLGDDELVRSFVVRHKWLELCLEALKENAASTSSNRHLLVVGPRGSGKTMLVRRVAAEVRSNPEYGQTWFPVVYGEESYQVSSAGEFWLEAMVHLSNSLEHKFGRTLDELREEQKDARLRERAVAQLLDFAESVSKRLLLVVENLNMLCEQITPESAWELRHTLINEPRIMLLGTATTRFDEITHAGRAWYELFAVHELKPLHRKESHTLWQAVANQDLKPGHVRAIRILTGGNPRLLTILAGFAANRSFRELMEQLVHLIDDHTEYFKGHLDALPPKERKVFVAVLEHWNPVTAADLARSARMSVNEVSALLNRLVSRGAVELPGDRPRRKLYQASERLYNIYYLMRRRGQPADRVRAAVSFMVMFYGGRQLARTIADLAREACGLPAGKSDDHFTAYTELAQRVPHEVLARALEQTPPEFFDRPDTPASVRCLPKASSVASIMKRANELFRRRNWSEAERLYQQAIAVDPNPGPIWQRLGWVLEEMGRLKEAEEALRKSIDLGPARAPAWNSLGDNLAKQGQLAEAEQAFRRAIDVDPNDPCSWHNLGYLLGTLKRYKEGEQACRKAIELDPGHVGAWSDLGTVLSRRGHLEEAERAFRKAIDLDPKDEVPWVNLGALLRRRKRHTEAKSAYQTAIGLNPHRSDSWDDLGHLISEVDPPEEAEKFWEEALRQHPSLVHCTVHLLEARLQRGLDRNVVLSEAEEWIKRSGRSAAVLASMARLVLGSNLTEALPRAERWAREAAAKDPRERTAEALVLVLAAEGKWPDALQTMRPVADATATSKEAVQRATEFVIQAASAGHARAAVEMLTASKGAEALEPLIIGLRIYLGEAPQVAKEILEIGHDVAERIRELATPKTQAQTTRDQDAAAEPTPAATSASAASASSQPSRSTS
jgi:tetratricopeptide (TPR) repeat protein